MNINNTPSFGAIRVPLQYGSQQNLESAKKAASAVFFKYRANGITDPDYYAMFFQNKANENMAEKFLKAGNIKYTRSDLADVVSADERNFWALNGRFPTAEELKEYLHELFERMQHHS